MDYFFFWREWSRPYAGLFKILFVFFILLAAVFVALYFSGNGWAYEWNILNRIRPVQVPNWYFETGLFRYFVEGVNYLNFQEFEGSEIQVHKGAAVALSIIFFLSLSFLVTISSYLSRFWFLLSMGVFIFLGVLLKLENLELFGSGNQAGLIAALALYIGPAYYFNAFRPDTTFFTRLTAFIMSSAAVILLLSFFSEITDPLLAFAGFGLIPPVIIAILFIFLIAHDIVSFFLYIITNHNNEFSKNSALHFVIISGVYLISLVFLFLRQTATIDWTLVDISPFFILLLSAFIGLWEFRHRRTNYENILPFNPLGAYLYLIMGIVCFSVIGYFFLTANDPIIETFEDAIVFSHLGFGLGFFIYVLANFFTILYHNKQVYKVVYKPSAMPYFTARLAGVIAVLALFFYSNKIGYNQARSGVYNAIGDYYNHTDNARLAKEYYDLGAIYGYNNHRSNYNLAHLYLEEGNTANALYYFERALRKRPTEFAYVNLGSVYYANGDYFQSLFALQDGISRFPGSGPIANNLSMVYNRTNVLDSILYYMEAAAQSPVSREAAQANLYGFFVDKNLRFTADSLTELYSGAPDIIAQTHALALMNERSFQPPLAAPSFLHADTALTVNQYAFLQNYAINQAGKLDSAVYRNLSVLIRNSGSFFSESLLQAQALAAYDRSEVFLALDLLAQLANSYPENAAYYANLTASIALEQNAPRLALEYLDAQATDTLSAQIRAAAYAYYPNLPDADTVFNGIDLGLIPHVAAAREINDPAITVQNDTIKHFYLTMHASQLDRAAIESIASSIENAGIRRVTFEALLNRSLERRDVERAEFYLGRLEEASGKARPEAELRLAFIKNDRAFVAENFEKVRDELRTQNLLLYEAIDDLQNNKTTEAGRKLEALAAMNPFFEEGILTAAEFFSETENDELKAYNILLNAMNYNKYSSSLVKAYILSALRLGLSGYAEEALSRLEGIAAPGEFNQFKEQYDTLSATGGEPWR